MNKLPELSFYDAAFIEAASKWSPAVTSYLRQSPPLTPEDRLRTDRNQQWLLAALATLNGAPASDVCRFWSDCADEILRQTFRACFGQKKVALFALGKLGSRELNLSSDVDVMIVSLEQDPTLISDLRHFQKTLSDRTAAGFVYRVDFDLRAGGRNGPLIATLDQFRDYYGNYGETWERMAFVRLRPIAGDSEIQTEVSDFAQKFTYRRHLDFTLMEDLKTMRQKIHAHYWDRAKEDEFDLKLGLGGIRDVELFVHALQVIHGGRDPILQKHATDEALDILKQKNVLAAGEIDFLRAHYWNLRTLENFVQCLDDEQTHILRLHLQTPPIISAVKARLIADCLRCDKLVSTLLGEAPTPTSAGASAGDFSPTDEEMRSLWEQIQSQEAQSHSKQRDENARQAFLQEFVKALQAQGGDLKQGLYFLRDFVASTKAKATFFSLLLRQKKLLDQLAWLFGHSPYLSRILCSRPELLDSFVYQSQDQLPEDWDRLLETLSERKLLSELVNGSDFLNDKDIMKLTARLTSTADSIVVGLLERLKRDYPSSIKILALGKWGGREMGFRSDLDFIFVTPNAPDENDLKLARRFTSRLTDAHRGGQIYAIDMRLRPSGKAGPLVAVEKDLETYLRDEASPWERQAYLKARWLGGEGFDPRAICIDRDLTSGDLQELERIRKELLPKTAEVDLKYSEGGLIDVEFAAQSLLLEQKKNPESSQTMDFLAIFERDSEALRQNYMRLRQIEQMLQLIASHGISEVNENHESFPALAVALQMTQEELKNEINLRLRQNLQLLNRLDPRRRSH